MKNSNFDKHLILELSHMYYNEGRWVVVSVVSCILARFTGRPHDDGKGMTYRKKRLAAVTETEIEKLYQRETNRKVNGGDIPSLGRDCSGYPG